MGKSKMSGSRAWNILRMALLWARKGGVFKRRLAMELRVVPKFLKNLHLGQNQSSIPRDQIRYGERQLSFDKTPNVHVKMHRPASLRFSFPCISAQDDFDYDFDGNDAYDDDDDVYSYDNGRTSFIKESEEEYEYEEVKVPCEEIDLRAEEFIAKFYEQMKMQRQISYLQYTETQNI